MMTIDAVRPLTVAEYHKMGDVGILAPGERVELIQGVIRAMTPIGAVHIWIVNRLNSLFVNGVRDRFDVSVQNPVVLADDSEPQPDIAILTARRSGEPYRAPTAADVHLLVEVSDSTLSYDRKVKVPLYAIAGIPELWIVDTTSRVIEQYRSPLDGDYQHLRVWRGGETILTTLNVPVRVDEIFT